MGTAFLATCLLRVRPGPRSMPFGAQPEIVDVKGVPGFEDRDGLVLRPVEGTLAGIGLAP